MRLPGGKAKTSGGTENTQGTNDPTVSAPVGGGSSTETGTQTGVTTPGKPSLSTPKNNKKKTITVKWKKVSGVKGYEVQYSLDKKFPKGKKTKTKTVKSAKTTSLTIKKLKKGKTYYVRVRAYKLNGKNKIYGAWSTKKKVKIKK